MMGNWITCEKCSKPVEFMMHVWSQHFMDVSPQRVDAHTARRSCVRQAYA